VFVTEINLLTHRYVYTERCSKRESVNVCVQW